MSIRCVEDECKAEIMGLDDLPARSVAQVYPDWTWTAQGWVCPTHGANAPAVTSDDVERAAMLAWNEALTQAAAAARLTCMSLTEGTRVVSAILALKRTT